MLIKLKKNSIFKEFSEIDIRKILEEIDYKFIQLKKEEILFFRGDSLESLNIILDGTLSAEMLKDNGEIKKIEDLKEGEMIASAFIFGDSNILPVDLRALSDSLILRIEKKELLKIFSKNERVLKSFLDEISNKTQFLTKKIWKSFVVKTIKEKLDDYIEENTKGDIVFFKKSIKELAELFSVSRPSLSRVIGNYISEGKLEKIGKNKYKIKKSY